ncbi:hypothetical protein BD413DRAFT_571555 [Trametes elegans]|nr:hypothetical protein BD413DRAFT_571555 [Trametes elegans]
MPQTFSISAQAPIRVLALSAASSNACARQTGRTRRPPATAGRGPSWDAPAGGGRLGGDGGRGCEHMDMNQEHTPIRMTAVLIWADFNFAPGNVFCLFSMEFPLF